MRILVLCTELKRFFGAEKVAATLARALHEQYGHSVHLAYLWGGAEEDSAVHNDLVRAGVPCTWLQKPYDSGLRHIGRAVRIAQQLVNSHKAALVHSHTFQLDAIASMLGGDLIRCRTLHNSLYHEGGWKGYFYRPFQRYWMASRFAATVAVAPSLAEHWRTAHPHASPSLHLIPNPISERFYQGAKARIAPSAPYQVGVIGRLSEQKGQADAIEALYLLRQKGTPIRLHLAGAGADQAALEAQAQRLGIANEVHFLGHINEEKVAQLHKQLDILWAPSRYEGFGLMVYEALAGGLPIVATPVVGLKEALSATNAPEVPPKNPKALAEATLELLTKPQKYAEVSKKGIKMAKAHRLTQITAGYHRLFQNLLA